MINREFQPVQVVSFAPGSDVYGQQHKGQKSVRMVQMVVKIYQQTSTSDIRYTDVSLLGLTPDEGITDNNEIIIVGEAYKVMYVNPSGRLHQIFMKKV